MSDSASNAEHRRQLWQISTSYLRSRVLTTAARLGIADALSEGERSVDDLATACQAAAFSLRRLLRALATIGVVSESRPDRFVLTRRAVSEANDRFRRSAPITMTHQYVAPTGLRPRRPAVVHYLLGLLPEEDAERLDELSIANEAVASRLCAVENDLVDAYIRGTLAGDTLHRFESF